MCRTFMSSFQYLTQIRSSGDERVADDIHRMADFVMEIRKVSIIIGIIAIVVGFMYLVVKVAKRNLQYKNEHRQFETMREKVKENRNAMMAPCVQCRPELWYTQRSKRCMDMEGDVCAVKGWANKGTLSEFSLKREPYEEVHEG
ncbi:unnamed protein product [Enterobius vermicularis]|uniref:PSI domain-containing protein n=1 Tax=Enterobius vermicularis TaxID=51028 RepID=A0A0N4V0S7_ENTVE|nr:unnamed protein product [Enterobius vermicularis]